MGDIVNSIIGNVFGSTYQSRQDATIAGQQMNVFQQQQAQMQPWIQAGSQAVGQLSAGMQPGGQFANASPTLQQLQQDPILGMMMSKDNNAAAAYASSVGNYGSSTMVGALQDIQSNEYANAYQRYQQSQNTLFNRLSGIAGTGMTGQMNVGAQGQNAAGTAAMYNSMGAQNMGGAFNGLGQALGGGLNDYLRYQAMQGQQGGGYNWSSLYGSGAGSGAGAAGASDLSYMDTLA